MRKLVLVLGIVFLFAACDNGDMENDKNPLIGTWEDTWEDESGDTYFERFIFNDNEVTRETNNETNAGTYEYDDEKIYFDYTSPNVFSIRADYSIKINILTMTFLNTHKTYTYKKVK